MIYFILIFFQHKEEGCSFFGPDLVLLPDRVLPPIICDNTLHAAPIQQIRVVLDGDEVRVRPLRVEEVQRLFFFFRKRLGRIVALAPGGYHHLAAGLEQCGHSTKRLAWVRQE